MLSHQLTQCALVSANAPSLAVLSRHINCVLTAEAIVVSAAGNISDFFLSLRTSVRKGKKHRYTYI